MVVPRRILDVIRGESHHVSVFVAEKGTVQDARREKSDTL